MDWFGILDWTHGFDCWIELELWTGLMNVLILSEITLFHMPTMIKTKSMSPIKSSNPVQESNPVYVSHVTNKFCLFFDKSSMPYTYTFLTFYPKHFPSYTFREHFKRPFYNVLGRCHDPERASIAKCLLAIIFSDKPMIPRKHYQIIDLYKVSISDQV